MTERERLIELLGGKNGFTEEDNDVLADYLLENGVTILPCKVGDTVYYIDSVRNENGKLVDTIRQQKVKQISTNSHGTFLVVDYCNTLNCEDVGVTIFFKRKDAEKELERRKTI